MPDVLERLVIEQAMKVATHVLGRLLHAGEPIHYAHYVTAMERYGFDPDLAKDTLFELGYDVTDDLHIKKAE